MEDDKTPYVSVWMALDDMTEENGTLYMIPYPNRENSIKRQKLDTKEDLYNHHHNLSLLYKPKTFYQHKVNELGDDSIETPIFGDIDDLHVLNLIFCS